MASRLAGIVKKHHIEYRVITMTQKTKYILWYKHFFL